MKRKIAMSFILLVICLVIVRIIYVNCTYPYAGIIHKNQDDLISYRGGNYTMESVKIYNKSSWLEYISSVGIEEEVKAHKILHSGMDDTENINNYDYYVSYNPDESYKVLVVELSFDGSDISQSSIERDISVVRRINYPKEFLDRYYSNGLQEYLNGGQDKEKLVQVYIIPKDIENIYLQSLELGNNVMVKLKPEIIE